jgi:hypothetical protein
MDLKQVEKFFNRQMCIVNDATEHSNLQFLVIRDCHSSLWVLSNQRGMAACLTVNDKPNALERTNGSPTPKQALSVALKQSQG